MFNAIFKKLTKNYHEVPLFYVEFSLKKFLKSGSKGSCTLVVHPTLKGDKYIVENLNSVVDYIRDNYDMEELAK